MVANLKGFGFEDVDLERRETRPQKIDGHVEYYGKLAPTMGKRRAGGVEGAGFDL